MVTALTEIRKSMSGAGLGGGKEDNKFCVGPVEFRWHTQEATGDEGLKLRGDTGTR